MPSCHHHHPPLIPSCGYCGYTWWALLKNKVLQSAAYIYCLWAKTTWNKPSHLHNVNMFECMNMQAVSMQEWVNKYSSKAASNIADKHAVKLAIGVKILWTKSRMEGEYDGVPWSTRHFCYAGGVTQLIQLTLWRYPQPISWHWLTNDFVAVVRSYIGCMIWHTVVPLYQFLSMDAERCYSQFLFRTQMDTYGETEHGWWKLWNLADMSTHGTYADLKSWTKMNSPTAQSTDSSADICKLPLNASGKTLDMSMRFHLYRTEMKGKNSEESQKFLTGKKKEK